MRLATPSFLTGLLLATANASANSEEYSTASSPATVSTHPEECSVTAKRVTVTAVVTETALLPISSIEVGTSKNHGPATSEITNQSPQGKILTIVSTQTVVIPGTSLMASKALEGKILTIVASVSTEHTTITPSGGLVSSASCPTLTAQGTGAVLTIVAGTSTISEAQPPQTVGPALLHEVPSSQPSISPCPGETSKSCSLMAPDNHTMVVGELYSEVLTSAFTSTWASQNSSNTVVADYAPVTPVRPRSIIACKSDDNYDTTVTDFYYSTTVVYVSSSANSTSVSTHPTPSSQELTPSSAFSASTPASQTPPIPTVFPSSGSNSTSSKITTGADSKSHGSEVLSEGLPSNTLPASAFPKCSPNLNGSCVAIATAGGQTPTLSIPGSSSAILSTSLSHVAQTVPSSPAPITSSHSASSTGTLQPFLTAGPCGPNAGADCVDPGETHPTLPVQTSKADFSSTSLSASTQPGTSTSASHSSSESSTLSVTPTATSGSSRNLPIPRWLLMLCFLGAALAASPVPSSSAPSQPASKPPVSSTATLVSQLNPSVTSIVPITAPIHGEAEMNANMHVWAMLLEAAHVTVPSRSRPQTTGTTSSPINTSSAVLPAASISSTAGGSSSSVSSSLVPKTTTSSSLAKRDPPLIFSMTFQQPSPTPCAGDSEWICVPMGGNSTYSWNPATLGHPPVVATTSARSTFAPSTSQPINETVTVVQTVLSTVTASTPLPTNTQKSTSAKIFKVPFLLVLLCLSGSVFAITEPRPALQVDSVPETRINLSDRTLVDSTPENRTQNNGRSPMAGYVHDPAEIERLARRKKIVKWLVRMPLFIFVLGFIALVATLSRPRPHETATQTHEGSLPNTARSLLYRSTPGAASTTQQSSSPKHLIVPVLSMALCFAGSVFALSAPVPKSASIPSVPRFGGSGFDAVPLDPPAPGAHTRRPEQPADNPEAWTVEEAARDRLAMNVWLEKKRRSDTIRFQLFISTIVVLVLCFFWYMIYKASKHISATRDVATQAQSLVGTAKLFLYRSAPGTIVRANTSQTSSASNFKVPFLLMFFCLALPAFAFGQSQSTFGFDQGATKEHNLGTRTVLAPPVRGKTAIEIPMAELAQDTPGDDAEQARQTERDTFGTPVVANEDELGRKKNKGYYVFLVAFYVFLLGLIAAIAVTFVVVLQHRHDPTYRRDLPARAQPTVVSGTPQGPGNYANSSGSSTIRNIPILLFLTCLVGSVMAVTPPYKSLDFDIPTKNSQLNGFDSQGSIKVLDHNLEDISLNDMGSSSNANGQPVLERGTLLPMLPPAYEYPAQVSQMKKTVWYKRRKNICILVLVGIILGLCILLGAIFLLRLGGSNGNNTNTNIVQNPVVSVPAPTVTLVVTSVMSLSRPVIFATLPRTLFTTKTARPSTVLEISSSSTATRAPNPGPNMTGGTATASSVQSMTSLTSTGSPLGIPSSVTTPEFSSTSRASNTGPITTGGAMSLTPTGVGLSDPLQHIGGGLVNMQAKYDPSVKARENSSEPIIIGGAKEGGMSDATSGSTRNFNIPSWYSPLLLARPVFGKPQDSLNTSLPDPVAVVYHTSMVTAPPVTATTVQTVFSDLGDYNSSKNASRSTSMPTATISSHPGNGLPAASIQSELATAGPTAALQESLGFALGYGMQRPLVLLTLCVVVCVVLPLGFWSNGRAKYAKRQMGGREKLKARVEGLVRRQNRGKEDEEEIEKALDPVGEIKDSFKARLRTSKRKNLKEDEDGWIIV